MFRSFGTLQTFWILSGASLLLALHSAQAQPAVEFFHQGATNYIFGHVKEAKKAVEDGLKMYPGDAQLTQLARLLEQEEKNSQSQNDEKKDQDKDDQSKQDEQKKEQQQQKQDEQQSAQQKPEQQDQQGQKKEEQQSKKSDEQQKQDQQRQAQRNQTGEKNEEQKEGEQGQAVMARMTAQQAVQLLESFKSEERTMIFTPPKTNRQDRVFKDW